MSGLSPIIQQNLIITGFVLFVIDRTLGLWVVSLKARRILAKRVSKNDPDTVSQRAIKWIEADYGFVQAAILLLAYVFLGILQTVQPDFIVNDVGKAGIAFIGFFVSLLSTTLNSFIEKLDAKP